MGRPRLHQEGELCVHDCGREKGRQGYHKDGTERYRATCHICHKARYSRPWLLFRRDECDYCGHKPMFSWSLEVHHRDGDNTNNVEENCDTLCSNCHRDLSALIHDLDGDWEKAESLFMRFIKALIR